MPYLGKEPNASPSQTLGTGAAEDILLKLDGNAVDYHIGLDDSADKLTFGKGSTLGTTTSMTFDTNGIMDMPLQPAVHAHLASNQSVNNTTITKLSLATEVYDRNNDFDSSTNYRFTAPVDGLYLAIASVHTTGTDADNLIIYIQKNGGDLFRTRTHASASASMAANTTGIALLDANDYLEVFVHHNFGGATNMTGSKEYTWFNVQKIA
tara:strand:+ start:3543 stop:4169 length:627 start_codon:yes stop_codon:yes gene_type:complete